METDVNFNLQSFLADMRGEMLDGFDKVHAVAAQVRVDLVEHEKSDLTTEGEIRTRLVTLELLHNSVRWALRTFIAALVIAAVGFVFSMLHTR